MPSTELKTTAAPSCRSGAGYWLGAVLAEGMAVWLLWHAFLTGHGGSLIVAVIAHLAAAAVLFAMGTRPPARSSTSPSRVRLFGVLVLFLPAMGLAGSLILQLTCDRWIRARGLVEDFQTETAHRVVELPKPEERMDLKTFFDSELAVQPVMDILAGHDDNLKRGAIDTLRRIGTREAVNVLKKCLTDSSPEVRYHAHTALARLDEMHTRRIGETQQRRDTGQDQAGAHIQYAAHCAAYGESGLLDEDSRRHYLEMARSAYLTAHVDRADDIDLLLALGQVEMHLGAGSDAAGRFRAVLSRQPAHPRALIGLAEVYYDQRDAEGLKNVAEMMKTVVTGGDRPVNEEILINFWASPKGMA